jgi:hypothetical protein
MQVLSKVILLSCSLLFLTLVVINRQNLIPTVVAVTPPNNADAVSLSAELAILFSQPMSTETINSTTIQLRGADGTPTPAGVSYDPKRRIAEVSPNKELRADTVYELHVAPEAGSSPRSILGGKLADSFVTRFKTAATLQSQSQSDAPILIVTGDSNPFGGYYAEILRTEGLNLFSVADVEHLTPERLASTDVVILTIPNLPTEKSDWLKAWVRTGGNLITIRPEGDLLPFLGIDLVGDPVPDGYMRVNAAFEPGQGIVTESLQLHVPASRFELKGGVALAQLYETATRPLGRPATTLRSVGLGKVAAYSYDLAQSIMRTRQGNPNWINQERDGFPPRRANDLFFPDYVDMNKIGIPQADEQQRFFANLVLFMNRSRRPLPRFWYLPDGKRAAIILASDDHATKHGTHQAFADLETESPQGCRIEAWECYRATSYLTSDTVITPDQVNRYEAAGFEVGIHADLGCKNLDNVSVAVALSEQINTYGKQHLGIEKQETNRIHCISWNGWADTMRIERDHGIRLSMNYYYWPGSWIQGRSGFMTGSGFPMRIVDLSGKIFDIYQAATHIVNENGIDHATGIRFMIDRALGPEQFFGMFGTHYDFTDDFLSTIVSIAKERRIPLISAAQALRWVDARSNSRFERIDWDGEKLSFDVRVGIGADSMTVMLPLSSPSLRLMAVKCDGEYKPFQTVRIKSLEYASLTVRSSRCNATYESKRSSVVNSSDRVQ